jgi:hypothetical protein
MKLAVLTGDLVRSTELAPHELVKTFGALERAAGDIADWQGAPTGFTRYRGDGWQLILTRPKLTLRAALKIIAAVRSLGDGHATRIAVGLGVGELGQGGSLASAGGEAFVASGRALDDIGSKVQLTIAAKGAEGALYRLADHVTKGWTQAQSRAIEPLLAPDKPTHAEVARQLGISRQAVEKALNGAGFGAIEASLNLVEADDD